MTSSRRRDCDVAAIEEGRYENKSRGCTDETPGTVLRSWTDAIDNAQPHRGGSRSSHRESEESWRTTAVCWREPPRSSGARQWRPIVVVADEKHEISLRQRKQPRARSTRLQPIFNGNYPSSQGDVVGRSIDIFRPLPCLERDALDRCPARPLKTLRLADIRWMRASPILDSTAGGSVPYLEWRNRTREVPAARVQSVVEEASRGIWEARLPVGRLREASRNLAEA